MQKHQETDRGHLSVLQAQVLNLTASAPQVSAASLVALLLLLVLPLPQPPPTQPPARYCNCYITSSVVMQTQSRQPCLYQEINLSSGSSGPIQPFKVSSSSTQYLRIQVPSHRKHNMSPLQSLLQFSRNCSSLQDSYQIYKYKSVDKMHSVLMLKKVVTKRYLKVGRKRLILGEHRAECHRGL